MKPVLYKVENQDKRRRQICGLFIFIILSLGVITALVTIPVVITNNNNALNSQELPMPLLLVNQTSELFLGDDMMLSAGDVFVVQSLVANRGNVLIPQVALFSSDFTQTVCAPAFLDNTIGDMNPEEEFACVSIRMVDAFDLARGSLGPYEFFVTGIDNVTTVTNSTLDITPLDVNRKTELSIMFDQVIDLGVDGMLSSNDTITITTKLINTGNETLLNVTSRFETLSSLSPMEKVEYIENYTITLMNIQMGGFEVTEFASGTGITSLQEIFVNETFFANTTQTTFSALNITQTSGLAKQFPCSSPGDTLTIQFVVENVGTETLTDVSISDTRFSTFICSPMNVDQNIGTLLPGQQEICQTTYITVTSDYTAPNNGFVNSVTTVTGTRFTLQTIYNEIESNSIRVADGDNVNIRAGPHFQTPSNGFGDVRWNPVFTNVPSNWNNIVFTVPFNGTYRVEGSFRALVGFPVVTVHINDVSTAATELIRPRIIWEGDLVVGDQVKFRDVVSGDGLRFPNSGSYICITDI